MMQFVRSFFKRIVVDLKEKKLVPLKILFFVHASTLFVLYPYLTIHMRELGINVEETAIMSAVTPVISIVMPPLAGMLADKIGNFRLLLALSSALGGASALLLLAVPVGRLTVTFPPQAELLATCDPDSALRLRNMQPYTCSPTHPFAYDVNLTILSCGFVCEIPDISDEDVNFISHVQTYDIHLPPGSNDQRLVYRHSLTSYLPQSSTPEKDQSTSRIMTNDPFFNLTITKISDSEIYFPAPRLYTLVCDESQPNITCDFGNEHLIETDIDEDESEPKYRVRISHNANKVPGDIRNYWIEAITPINASNSEQEFDQLNPAICSDNFDKEDGVRVHVGSKHFKNCLSACAASVPRKTLCNNLKQQIELDPTFTFWAYLAVRVFIGIIGGTAFAMFEGAVIAIVREQKADYGLQRVYGSIGGMISSPLSGLLIDYASRGKGYTDFRPAFYLYAILKVASGVLMLTIDLEFKQPAQNLLEDVLTVLKSVEIVALFIACFIMGTAWGYIESFLFWLLQDLGASRSLMGITITVGGIAGLPLLVLSGPIIRRLGHANVLFIGFIFYAIRLLGYSLIYNPWLCLVFEALESVTSSLSFTAAVTYAARLSSTTTDTSVQGLLGGLYYGVGKGSGSLIGGYLMKAFGTRPTYQIFAAATLLTGCIYFLFNKFYLRKHAVSAEHDIYKKKPAIDVEAREAKATDKSKEVITKTDKSDNPNDNNVSEVPKEKIDSNNLKLSADNVDGGSDSGVDNPAYNDTDNSTDVKKEEPK